MDETKKIDILAMQGTHMNQTVVETRKEYTWYYSGSNGKGEEGNRFAGVGFIIQNTLAKLYKGHRTNQ